MAKAKYELQDGVALITLNDPATLNAISVEMTEELNLLFDRACAEARCVVLTGEGRGFSSGANLAGGAPQSALTRLDLQSVARPEVLMAADARTRTGDAQTVAQALRVWVADHPNDAAAWMLLAAAYDNQGQRLRAIRAEAEARVAQGDLSAASDRFKAAQDLARGGLAAGDHIEASIIDSRARQVELLLREQALER